VGVPVGMVVAGELPEGLLDFLVGGRLPHAQDCVVVLEFHQSGFRKPLALLISAARFGPHFILIKYLRSHMDVQLSDFVTIGLLVLLEGLLSADNALALALMILRLPPRDQ